MRLALLTPWAGAGTAADPFRPQVADAAPLAAWADLAGTPAASLPPVPNLTAIAADAAPAVMAAILADPALGPAVLWAEGTDQGPDGVPTEAGYQAVVQAFAASLGLSTAYIHAVVGETPAGRTRETIAAQLAGWLRTRPKGEG